MIASILYCDCKYIDESIFAYYINGSVYNVSLKKYFL